MHLKLVTLLAFAVEAMAAAHEHHEEAPGVDISPPATTPPPSVNQAPPGDLINVLLTALPASILDVAVTNQPAVSNIIASEFNAGVTPPWFKSLPPPVQTYLANPGTPGASAVPTETPRFFNVTTTGPTTPRSTLTPHANTTGHRAATLTTTELGTTTPETTPQVTPSRNQTTTAGAMPLPLPTAAIGAGVVGALGILGFLGL